MFDIIPLSHHIQKFIIGVLIHQHTARFSELRPPRTDSNLFSYHLKALLRDGLVEKRQAGYTLSRSGLAYVDRVSVNKLSVRSQPKIVTMIVVKNEAGETLLMRRKKQPYIDAWTLPYGKIHIDDLTIADAARREVLEKTGLTLQNVAHRGDGYIRVWSDEFLLSNTLAHVFVGTTTTPLVGPDVTWLTAASQMLHLAPAVERIITLSQRSDGHFFEEIDESW